MPLLFFSWSGQTVFSCTADKMWVQDKAGEAPQELHRFQLSHGDTALHNVLLYGNRVMLVNVKPINSMLFGLWTKQTAAV